MNAQLKYYFEQLHRLVGQRLVMSAWWDLPVLMQWRDSKYRRLFDAGKGLHVGHHVYIDREHNQLTGSIQIGMNVFLGHDVLLDYTGHLKIGDGVRILQSTHVFTHRHDILERRRTGRNPIEQITLEIADRAYIGSNVTILPGCHRIGKDAIVGAGAVVTHDVEDYAMVVGNPARKIKDLRDNE